jgi:hypothetical protein
MERLINTVSTITQLWNSITPRNPEDGGDMFSARSVRTRATQYNIPECINNCHRVPNKPVWLHVPLVDKLEPMASSRMCRSCENWRFEGSCRLHLQGRQNRERGAALAVGYQTKQPDERTLTIELSTGEWAKWKIRGGVGGSEGTWIAGSKGLTRVCVRCVEIRC